MPSDLETFVAALRDEAELLGVFVDTEDVCKRIEAAAEMLEVVEVREHTFADSVRDDLNARAAKAMGNG